MNAGSKKHKLTMKHGIKGANKIETSIMWALQGVWRKLMQLTLSWEVSRHNNHIFWRREFWLFCCEKCVLGFQLLLLLKKKNVAWYSIAGIQKEECGLVQHCGNTKRRMRLGTSLREYKKKNVTWYSITGIQKEECGLVQHCGNTKRRTKVLQID